MIPQITNERELVDQLTKLSAQDRELLDKWTEAVASIEGVTLDSVETRTELYNGKSFISGKLQYLPSRVDKGDFHNFTFSFNGKDYAELSVNCNCGSRSCPSDTRYLDLDDENIVGCWSEIFQTLIKLRREASGSIPTIGNS